MGTGNRPMIAWSKRFPRRMYPLGYLRLIAARHRFYDRIGWLRQGKGWKIGKVPGDQTKLESLRGIHAGNPCLIIGNGPSLNEIDFNYFRSMTTIGCNGIYRAFEDWGFHTNYLLFEDIEQTELHGPNISTIKGPVKIASLYNAHNIRGSWKDLLFMNSRLADFTYWNDIGIQFSRDFSHVVYLGSSITYVALQLAYHLGCNPIYLVGVDMDYGELTQMHPPGKIEIDVENIDKVRGVHFDENYYAPGDVIGVPDFGIQLKALEVAKAAFLENGRQIFNATPGGKLELFPRIKFESIFENG
jgi:hypothetical protein